MNEEADRLIRGIKEAADKLFAEWLASKAVDINALATIEARTHLLSRLITKR